MSVDAFAAVSPHYDGIDVVFVDVLCDGLVGSPPKNRCRRLYALFVTDFFDSFDRILTESFDLGDCFRISSCNAFQRSTIDDKQSMDPTVALSS